MSNKTIISTICLLAVFACTNAIYAQNAPEDLAKKFFTDFETQGSAKALDNLYSTNKWMSHTGDIMRNLKSKLSELNEDFVGKYYGHERLVKKELANSFVLISYLVKYERQPVRFTFEFYKPNDKWITYSFQFDTEVDDEIESAAKLFYLELKN